jgi:DNA-binding SARP family transcriptional activator
VVELRLLGELGVVSGGGDVTPSGSAARLLALIALRRRPVERRVAAGALWPDVAEARAAANLRSTVWRLRRAGIDLVEGDARALWLRPSTVVDVIEASDWALRLIDGDARDGDRTRPVPPERADSLLPAIDDPWLVVERERLRERLLHAWEALGRQLVAVGRPGEAEQAAAVVVAAEPLRESGLRVLVDAHLAAGRPDEARRAVLCHRRLMSETFGPASRSGPSTTTAAGLSA